MFETFGQVGQRLLRDDRFLVEHIDRRSPHAHWICCALVWAIPFIAIIQLLAVVGDGMLGGGRDETLEIISTVRNYFGPAAILLWLILSLMGKLPGTSKHRRRLVNYELRLEMRDAGSD